MIRFLLRYLIFLFTGWKIDNRTNLKINDIFNKRVICIFSHTSSFDVLPFVFTKISYNVNSIGITLKNHYYSNIFKRLFFFIFNIFPIEEKGNVGMTKMISNKLNQVSPDGRLSFAISPEGSRDKVERFKSGFYYIAKNTNSDILICLPCFETNTLIFQDIFTPTDLESTLIKVEKGFAEGIPLYPQNVHYQIIKHKRKNLTIIDWGRFSHLLGIFLYPQYSFIYLIKLYYDSEIFFIDFLVPMLYYKNYLVSIFLYLQYVFSFIYPQNTKWKICFSNITFLLFNYILLNFVLNF